MFLDKVLHVWDNCRETENFIPFIEAVKVTISAGINYGEIVGVADTKSFNSILSAACSEHYPTPVQKTVLDLIQFLGSNISMRYRLIHSFLILKTLIYGLCAKPTGPDQLRLLKLVQLFTVDLHHLCPTLEPELFSYALRCALRVIGQNKHDEFLEPALGVLASLARFTNLIHKHLSKKNEFERLRKCLLHIMSSDAVSQSSLIFSMTIRFHLWKSSDKFFEGPNVHKTVQVLFNSLLNGEIDLGGLCAGELLSDLCAEPTIMPLLGSFPELTECIREIVIQLKSKDTSLVIKLLHLLYRLAENKTNPEVAQLIRGLVFSAEANRVAPNANGNPPAELDMDDEQDSRGLGPLRTLFALSTGNDDLVASAALDFLLQISIVKPNCETTDLIPHEIVLEHIIDGMRKLGNAPPFRPTCDSVSTLADSVFCGRLLRLSLFIRLADQIVCQLQSRVTLSELGNTECTFLSSPTSSGVLIDHLSVLSEFLHQTSSLQLNVNPLLSLFALPVASTDPMTSDLSTDPRLQMDVNSLVSASVIIEAMGLIYAIAELLSTVVPPVSQDDEVSATQPTEAEDEETVTRLGEKKTIQTVARQCGQSLQSLLERAEVSGTFALGLLTTSKHFHVTPQTETSMPLGMGPASRRAVIRLLSTALHWDGFDNDQFIHNLNRLQPGNTANGTNLADLLERISNSSEPSNTESSGLHPCCCRPAFLARWIQSPVSGDPSPATSQSFSSSSNFSGLQPDFIDSNSGSEHACMTEALAHRVDRFLQTWEGNDKKQTETSIQASDLLTVMEYKIQMFKSREDVLESSAFANAEALASVQRLSEHYRQRLAMAEAESGRLRSLQIEALARLEADKRLQLAYAERLEK
ncbi:Protein CIP2A [Fasciola hepatica]|uniref:Protein CIP2A n=1 Tax=Fasciola hepatica TaxID=6192 RepID=A0A4E0RHZ1_FASHE|nr:Protein CIP2A [Fasciola hepatica]